MFFIQQADKLIDGFGKARWDGEILLPQTDTFVEGDLLSLTSVTYDFDEKLIRVIEVHDSIWNTVLMLEEDERSVTVNLK